MPRHLDTGVNRHSDTLDTSDTSVYRRPERWPDTPTLAPDMIPTAARQSRQPRHPTAPTAARQPRQPILYFPTVTTCVHCQGRPDSPDSPDRPDTRQCSTGPTPPTAASDRGRCKRGPSCPYISAQSPSPRMFLKNLRQRIVQYYIKIEPCHAKVFRPTMVQRHIRDRANADSAVCTPKHQTMLCMSAQSPLNTQSLAGRDFPTLSSRMS